MATVIEVGGIPSMDNVFNIIRRFGNQVDFAISLGLNYTADDVRENAVRTLLPRKLTLRRPWYKPRTRFGINVAPANKRNLQAVVFSRAPWLKLQEKGGTKVRVKTTPGQSKKLVLIPRKDLRKTKGRLVPARLSPAKLLKDPAKNRVFFIGDNLYRRSGRGKNKKLELLFFGVKSASIRPVLQFEATGEVIVRKRYQKNFGRALARAIATARGDLRRTGNSA